MPYLPLHDLAQGVLAPALITKAMPRAGGKPQHPAPIIGMETINERGNGIGPVGDDYDLQTRRQQRSNLGQYLIDRLPVVAVELRDVLLPHRLG